MCMQMSAAMLRCGIHRCKGRKTKGLGSREGKRCKIVDVWTYMTRSHVRLQARCGLQLPRGVRGCLNISSNGMRSDLSEELYTDG